MVRSDNVAMITTIRPSGLHIAIDLHGTWKNRELRRRALIFFGQRNGELSVFGQEIVDHVIEDRGDELSRFDQPIGREHPILRWWLREFELDDLDATCDVGFVQLRCELGAQQSDVDTGQ